MYSFAKLNKLIFLFLHLSCKINAQNFTINQQEIQEEWKIFKEIQLKMNPATYQYHTHKQIDSIVKWADAKIKTTNNLLDFYKILNSFSSYQGSAFNSISLPDSFFTSLSNDELFFPLAVKWNGERVFVNSTNIKIPVGSEIHAINGKKISDIIKDLSKYYSADGYNYIPKSTGINAAFDVYYWLEYGSQYSYDISYAPPLSKDIQHLKLAGISYTSANELFKNRHSISYDKDFYTADITPKFKWEVVQNNTCLLTINSLYFGNSFRDKEQPDFRLSIDRFFNYMALHPQFSNLIIDIRNLKDGNEMSASQVLQYLSEKKYSINKEEYLVSRTIVYPHLLQLKNETNESSKIEFALDWQELLAEKYPKKKNSKYYKNNKYFEQVKPANATKIFKGNIYLLIGSRVDKIGTSFASFVKDQKQTLVIGEETIGAYNQSNYKEPISYTLPHSKINFQFALCITTFAIHTKDKYYEGRGVKPTVEVRQSALDFIDNRDAVMEYTIRKINRDSE